MYNGNLHQVEIILLYSPSTLLFFSILYLHHVEIILLYRPCLSLYNGVSAHYIYNFYPPFFYKTFNGLAYSTLSPTTHQYRPRYVGFSYAKVQKINETTKSIMILYDIRSESIKCNKNYSDYYIESKTIIYFQTSVIITKNTQKTMI